MTKTVVGSFDSFDEAQRVVHELGNMGLSSDDVSIVANDPKGEYASRYGSGRTTTTDADGSSTAADVGKGAVTGGVLGGAAGLLAAIVGLTMPGVGTLVAAGPIAAALTGAGIGAVAGGLIGGLRHVGVPDEHAEYYAESVRRGGALVTVRAEDNRADEVAALMSRHGAHDIDSRVQQWRSQGWSRFDESAKPYSYEEIERERSAYRSGASGTGGSMGRTTTTGTTGSSMGSDVQLVDVIKAPVDRDLKS